MIAQSRELTHPQNHNYKFSRIIENIFHLFFLDKIKDFRKLGAIKRAFSLPATVDPSKSEARFEDEVLTVVMPKSKARKKRKKINVE